MGKDMIEVFVTILAITTLFMGSTHRSHYGRRSALVFIVFMISVM